MGEKNEHKKILKKNIIEKNWNFLTNNGKEEVNLNLRNKELNEK